MITQQLLKMGASLNEVQAMLHNGMISQRTYEAYHTLWEWGAIRFSSTEQERYFRKYGVNRLRQRRRNVAWLCERLKKG